jgi:hypothetical protein
LIACSAAKPLWSLPSVGTRTRSYIPHQRVGSE